MQMKHAPVGPEERKSILKKMYHALRQSPMFTHYSVEHIRDSAIKSEQLTFDRSFTKQEYMQAMNVKLAKIEKSYVMNSEEIIREMGNRPQIKSDLAPAGRPMGTYRDQMDPYKIDGEYSMHPKKAEQEFVSLTNSPHGRGINFSFVPDEGHASRIRSVAPGNHMGMGGPNITMGGMGVPLGMGSQKMPSHPQRHGMPVGGGGSGMNGSEMYGMPSGHIHGGHPLSGMNPGMGGMHSMPLGSGYGPGKTPQKPSKAGMYGHLNINSPEGAMGGHMNVSMSMSGAGGLGRVQGSGMPNIIKLDRMPEMGSAQGPRGARNDVHPIDIKEINLPREPVGVMPKGPAPGMDSPEGFVPMRGFGASEAGGFSRLTMNEHLGEIPGLNLTGGLHRTGAAGSTNTATKLNNSNRMYPSERSSKSGMAGPLSMHEAAASDARPVDLPRARPKIDKIESPLHVSPQESSPKSVRSAEKKNAGVQNEVDEILKEIQKMGDVLNAHEGMFPRWEAQRKPFYDLEKVLLVKIKTPESEMESARGIFQQMKKHIITLTMEIKEGRSLTFKKRLARISGAFMQKQKMQPEYQFTLTEELLLEYN
ncbi:uncharacterized protein NEMAJ01_0231 [Nematocida major]|uniref:uncharacterized protein n=1 Tax=Nematocida major TaxID=1912982 RepID=UPI00200813D4|nr:uncharacterized protein NEMAJ01_0231 [Nematocida major]KAH9385335.1 hypothetical protein NEMAJ01_0231 [Nematocida major]